jgi:hypothetical protein
VKRRFAAALALAAVSSSAPAQTRLAPAPIVSAPAFAPAAVSASGLSAASLTAPAALSAPALTGAPALSAVPAADVAAAPAASAAAPALAAARDGFGAPAADAAAPGEPAAQPARRMSMDELRRIGDANGEAIRAFMGVPGVRGVMVDVDPETGTRPHFVIALDGTRRPSDVRRDAARLRPALAGEVIYELRPDAKEPAPARTPDAGRAYLAAARGAGLANPLNGLDDPRLSDPRVLLAEGWSRESQGTATAYVFAPEGRPRQVYVEQDGARHLVTYRRGAEYVRAETLSRGDGAPTRSVDRYTPEQFAKLEARWLRQREIDRSPEEFARRARRLFANARRAESAAPRPGAAPEAVATDDEMRGRMERLPATNPEREKYVVELFKTAGARPDEIVLQDAGRGRHNILVVKKGRTDRVLVVGGHHDKVSAGAGAIDNGTGATMVANLYQALRDKDTDATIVFVAFAREEEGLIGSRRYLASLTPAQRAKIDAMVNLDTLAVDGTFSWRNNSTRALLDRARAVAAEKGRSLVEAYLDGGDADSSTFREAGVPALTLFGASQDVIFDVIHTDRDTMAAFDLAHYRNAYLLTLDLLESLDARPLGPVDGA